MRQGSRFVWAILVAGLVMAVPSAQATLYSVECVTTGCDPNHETNLSVQISASADPNYTTSIQFNFAGFSATGQAGINGIFFQDVNEQIDFANALVIPPFDWTSFAFPGPHTFNREYFSEEPVGQVTVLVNYLTPAQVDSAIESGLLRIGVSMHSCLDSSLTLADGCRGGYTGYLITGEVPEPGYLALLALGFGGLVLRARRKRAQAT